MNTLGVLHFSLGPVQGFVAQARRTRDLYAGSFLLSYLAGQAMLKVLRSEGEITFPEVHSPDERTITDPLLQAIDRVADGKKVERAPHLGTLPNRFRAEVPDGFDTSLCRRAVEDSWGKVAQAVWDEFLEGFAGGETRTIWKRQVNNFWDINWVLGDENNLLDRRKNWRSFVPAVEKGDKCTIMGNLQELSGLVRSRNRGEQKAFWSALRERISGRSRETLDLDDDERLCAISLIKRLYPRVAQKAIGWPVPVNYPSTSFMAAVHWVAQTIEANPQKAREFAALARVLPSAAGSEYGNRFQCINQSVRKHPKTYDFACLDGQCFNENSLINDRQGPAGITEIRNKMLKMLKEDFKDKPSRFYSLILMDGDHLGKLLGKYKNENDCRRISRALARFSGNVDGIIKKNNGVTVYAGGDDVLALLPLEDALQAALDLRGNYGECFREEFREGPLEDGEATLSGAIVYAQSHVPLKAVLTKAHHLLDQVAKEQTGRDSLAVTVWKGSGIALAWSAPWAVVKDGAPNLLDQLVGEFAVKDDESGRFNSTFFYNVRKRFSLLSNQGEWSDQNLQVDLLSVEYLKNRDRLVTIDEAREYIGRLLKLCRQSWRENGKIHAGEGPLSIDGALLVRFLAGKGVIR